MYINTFLSFFLNSIDSTIIIAVKSCLKMSVIKSIKINKFLLLQNWEMERIV